MDNKSLRVKFSKGETVIELEGDSSTVLSEIRSIKKDGVGRLVEFFGHPSLQTPPPSVSHANGKDSQPTIMIHKDIKGFPPLKDIVLKCLPKSEPEWIAIYSYFASNAGKKEFTRDDLWEQYKSSGRDTDNRRANLSNNIKQAVNKNWLSNISNDSFSLLPDGISRAQEIAKREKPAKRRILKIHAKKGNKGG